MKEALKLALELAEDARRWGESNLARKGIQTIAAIKEALAQPEKEPGVTTYKEVTDTMNGLLNGDYKQAQMAQYAGDIKLFHAPPQRPWVGFTDADYDVPFSEDWKNGMSYADAKLKEKNT